MARRVRRCAPGGTTRTSPLRTALRRLVFRAFLCAVVMIVLSVGVAVLGIAGVPLDPHGYGMFAGILFAVVLTPAALVLWVLYRLLDGGGPTFPSEYGNAGPPPPDYTS